MSNQIRRNLGRFMFSPASVGRFFRQHPIVVAGKLSCGLAVAHVFLTCVGLNYWGPEYRKRRESITSDVEMLEREVDSIKKKKLHARVQNDDTKTKAEAVCRVGG